MTLETLRLDGITKYYSTKLILHDINLTLNQGERAALVGENGVGKTTLTRIIIGEEVADEGRVRLAPHATVGYLPQAFTSVGDPTIQAYIAQAVGDLHRLQTEMERLEALMEHANGHLPQVLAEYGHLQEQFTHRGDYELPYRMEAVFAGLQIEYLEPSRVLSSLSGGERTRVALAALLLQAPDLLVLDEPTNHLDFAGMAWLERYLADYPHTVLMVTHDRAFIDRVATQIIELSPVTRTLKAYYGGYADYLAQRQAEYEQAVSAYNAQMAEMKLLRRTIKQQTHNVGKGKQPSDGDKFLAYHRKEVAEGLISRHIRSADQKLQEIQSNRLDNPRHEWTIAFTFAPRPLTSAEPLRLHRLTKAYADRVLFRDASATVQRGDRVVLAAPNGTGKSTLLKILTGEVMPDAGTFTVGPNVLIGYLDQEAEALHFDQTVIASYREDAQGDEKELMAQLHRCGLFVDGHLAEKLIRDLSVGMRRKLALAKIIARGANVLLLDEPTNHLDFMSLEALEAALLTFEGAVLAVSHDRRFIQRVATHVWTLQGEQLHMERVASH